MGKMSLSRAPRARVYAYIAGAGLACAVTASCTTSPGGEPIAALQTGAAPKAGTARLVVMRREKGFFGFGDRGLPVMVDNVRVGNILTATTVTTEIAPGHHEISIDLWDHPGVSRYNFTASAGKTYYVVAQVKERVNQAAMGYLVGGLVGYGIVQAANNDGTGPIELTPISEAESRKIVAAAR